MKICERRQRTKNAVIAVMMTVVMTMVVLIPGIHAEAAGTNNNDIKKAMEALLDVICYDDATAYVSLGIGTALEAHETHDNFVKDILSKILNDEMADTYYTDFEESIENMLSKAVFRVDSVKMQGNSGVMTISYRQLNYFPKVDENYKEYVKLMTDKWIEDLASAPAADEMVDYMLCMVLLSMENTLEEATYGTQLHAIVGFDFNEDEPEELLDFIYNKLYDIGKLESYVIPDNTHTVLRGYASNHGLSYSLETGNVFIGEVKNGQRNGKGIYIWADGERYAGGFTNGKRNGYGVYIWASGEKYEGWWVNDKQVNN